MPTEPRSITHEMLGHGEVYPENLSISLANISLPVFSTTDTTQWLTHTFKDFYVPTKRIMLYVDITLALWHSTVANAQFGYGLWIYDMDTGSPTNLVIGWQFGATAAFGALLPSTANVLQVFSWAARISFDTDHLNRNPGPKRVYFAIRNWTAGQLNTGDPANNTNAAAMSLVGK